MLQRGDVVNLKPKYMKYALGDGMHYGEDVSGLSWIVDYVLEKPDGERSVFAKPTDDHGRYLETIMGTTVPERWLVRNEFLTMIIQAEASEARRKS